MEDDDDGARMPSGSGSDSDDARRAPVTEAEILASIQSLHLRLEQVRINSAAAEDVDAADTDAPDPGASPAARAPEGGGAGAAPRARDARLIVVSNRLPVTLSKDERGDWKFRVSSGGLVSALEGVKNDIPFIWVGWTGKEVAAAEQAPLKQRFLDDINCYPVFLNAHE
eukprot:IDg16796t1